MISVVTLSLIFEPRSGEHTAPLNLWASASSPPLRETYYWTIKCAMAMQGLALREPALLAARHCLPPSPNRMSRLGNGRSATDCTGVLLDTAVVPGQNRPASKHGKGTEEDSFEISPVLSGLAPSKHRRNPEGSTSTSSRKGGRIVSASVSSPKPLHPFFLERKVSPSKVANINQTRKVSSMGTVNSLYFEETAQGPVVEQLSEQLKGLQLRNAEQTSQVRPCAPLGCIQVSSSQETSDESLPNYSYKQWEDPPIRKYIRTEDEANVMVGRLQGPIGFDMEWRVMYQRSGSTTSMKSRRTAVVQVCDEKLILVIQVYDMKRFPLKLKELIESKDVVKMGANILNDGNKLYEDYGVTARNLVELGALARSADPDSEKLFIMKNGRVRRSHLGIASLAKVVKHYCGMILEKPKERVSNWELPLTEKQLDYAANDAHSGLMAYRALLELARKNGQLLDAADFTSNVGEIEEPDTIGEAPASASTDSPMAFIPLTHTGMRPQYWRAYRYWHGRGMTMEEMCNLLRVDQSGPPLKASTVISYVIGALKEDETLPFDMKKLCDLVQVEARSWEYHRAWIMSAAQQRRGTKGVSLVRP